MYKRIVVGLMVAFVVAAALPMVAQAQPLLPGVSNCKYVGPADPLALNTLVGVTATDVKTIKAQKEIFYCYDTEKNVPDDKTLQDPLANRDKIAKGLQYIVEIEIFAFIIENLALTTGTTPPFIAGPSAIAPEIIGDNLGDDDGICEVDPIAGPEDCAPVVDKHFQATRCIKELRGPGIPGSTTLKTWVLAGCEVYSNVLVGPGIQPMPAIPATAARQCTTFGKSPWTGGPIPVEDPMEMNTVLSGNFFKTVKVNKEVFRCFTSGQPSAPAIYDIELYTEIYESAAGATFGQELGKAFEVAYCAKKEKEAILLGCSWRNMGINPFAAAEGLPAELRPFMTLRSVELKQSGGQYRFEAQGYNIEGVQVQVYNLAGKQVFSAEAAGNSLSWNGLSSDGRRLANGVYLYVLTVKGTYGDIVQTKVQKLAILR
jgi:hypothetical protein